MDATNIVDPTVTAITNIGLDHTEILGDTHAKIAVEKSGIIKPLVPCITAADNPDALATIERIAAERGAPLIRVRRGPAASPTGDPAIVYWDVERQSEEFGPVSVATAGRAYPNLVMRMGGLYQRENAACAIACAEVAFASHLESGRKDRARPTIAAGLQYEAIAAALTNTELPGRLTTLRLEGGPLVVLDGAHNALAARALGRAVASLRTNQGIHRLCLVIGMVGGHSPDDVLMALAPGAARVIACRPQWKRAQPAEEIAEAARAIVRNVETIASVSEATQAALTNAGPDTLILITGSFYTVGEVRPEDLFRWWHERIAR